MKIWRTLLKCLIVLAALVSCSSTSNTSANNFLLLERQLVTQKTSWIDADVALLQSACRGLTPAVERRVALDATAATDFNERRTLCAQLAYWTAQSHSIIKKSDTASSGDAFENLQQQLSALRRVVDAAIAAFPTSSLPESNFPSNAAATFRAQHEAEATEAGRLAADAVQQARLASDSAMKVALRSNHELDKARARTSDEAYTTAAAELSGVAALSSASDILVKVDEVFSAADGAVGQAQSTAAVAANPVSAAQEEVPSAAAADSPVPNYGAEQPAQPNAETNASAFATLIRSTQQMYVLESGNQGCDGQGGLQIRFKDDGTSGCAMAAEAIQGQLESGANVVLIPVSAGDKGVVFDLLYSRTGESVDFIGVLPGDGTGHLRVSIENGLLIERNEDRTKRSTLRGGKVVTFTT